MQFKTFLKGTEVNWKTTAGGIASCAPFVGDVAHMIATMKFSGDCKTDFGFFIVGLALIVAKDFGSVQTPPN